MMFTIYASPPSWLWSNSACPRRIAVSQFRFCFSSTYFSLFVILQSHPVHLIASCGLGVRAAFPSVSLVVFSAVANWVRAVVAVAACVRAIVFQPWPCGSVLSLFICTSVSLVVVSSCCHEARYTEEYQSGLDRCHEARYILCDISLDLKKKNYI